MNAKYCFDVDVNGEDLLISSLKQDHRFEFQTALNNGHDPFVPSPFGQCCGGLSGQIFTTFKKFDPLDWAFDQSCTIKTAVNPMPQFLKHATDSRLAYTLPYLSGIHCAAAVGDLDEIERLKDHVNDRDAFGYLPVIYAVGCCKPFAVQALARFGGHHDMKQGCFRLDPRDIVSGGRHGLPAAALKLWPKLIPVKPEYCPARHSLTIHQAAAKGDLNAIRTLLDLGVPVDIRSYNGSTALMCAVMYGMSEACSLLRQAGADLNAVNYMGETPLSILEKMRHSEQGIPIFGGQFATDATFRANDKRFVLSALEQAMGDGTHQLNKEAPQTDEVVDETVNQPNPGPVNLIRMIKEGVEGDDFQKVLHAYYCLEDVDHALLLRELDESLLKAEPTGGRSLIRAWLYLKAGLPIASVDAYAAGHGRLTLNEIIKERQPELLLAWIKAGHSISENDVLMNLALRDGDDRTMEWLLGMGISLHHFQDFSGPFSALILKEIDNRRSAVWARPHFLNDDILFALTTGNIEYFLDCLGYGLALSATTLHGLTLKDIAKICGLTMLEACLDMLEDGRPRVDVLKWLAQARAEQNKQASEISPDVQKASQADHPSNSDIQPDSNGESAVSENNPPNNSISIIPLGGGIGESPAQAEDEISNLNAKPDIGEIMGLPMPSPVEEPASLVNNVSKEVVKDSHGHSVTIIRVSSEKRELLDRILLKPMSSVVEKNVFKALSSVLAPPYLVGLFRKAQRCRNDEELRALVDGDDVTLELFWAMKLYAEAKAEALSKKDLTRAKF